MLYHISWQNIAKFLEDAQNPEFQKVLEQAFRELGTDGIVESSVDFARGRYCSDTDV